MAGMMLRGKPTGQTIQPTVLVHEAFLRLKLSDRHQWVSRAYFFGAAAEAMRRILVENARRKGTLRRGGKWVRVSLETVQLATDASSDLLLLIDEAISKLAVDYPKQADVVKLMFFAGLTAKEAAEALGVTDRTVKRHWAFARAWLYEELSEAP